MMMICYCPRCGSDAMMLPTDPEAKGRHNVWGCKKVRPDVSRQLDMEFNGSYREVQKRVKALLPEGVHVAFVIGEFVGR